MSECIRVGSDMATDCNALSYFDGFKIAKVGQQFVRDVALSTVVQCIERCVSSIQWSVYFLASPVGETTNNQ